MSRSNPSSTGPPVSVSLAIVGYVNVTPTERNVAESGSRFRSAGCGEVDRMIGIADLGRDVEDLVDPTERSSRALRERDRHPDHSQRPHEQRHVHVELDQRAE